jgi:hypothetical protein
MTALLLHDEIARLLGESSAASCEQIARVITHCGEPLAREIAEATLALERNGGMMTMDGTRRRTPCGVFFELVRRRVSAEDLFFIRNGRTRSEKGDTSAMPWSDRLAAAQEARAKSGEVSAVSMMIVGTPTRITSKDGFVLVTIEQKDIPPLPRGLPALPSAVTTFLVGVARSQWRIVERFVKNGEPLIASGYPLPDETKGRVVVYAMRVDTPSTKKIRMQKKKGQVGR